jgi:hypothetical protein
MFAMVYGVRRAVEGLTGILALVLPELSVKRIAGGTHQEVKLLWVLSRSKSVV